MGSTETRGEGKAARRGLWGAVSTCGHVQSVCGPPPHTAGGREAVAVPRRIRDGLGMAPAHRATHQVAGSCDTSGSRPWWCPVAGLHQGAYARHLPTRGRGRAAGEGGVLRLRAAEPRGLGSQAPAASGCWPQPASGQCSLLQQRWPRGGAELKPQGVDERGGVAEVAFHTPLPLAGPGRGAETPPNDLLLHRSFWVTPMPNRTLLGWSLVLAGAPPGQVRDTLPPI